MEHPRTPTPKSWHRRAAELASSRQTSPRPVEYWIGPIKVACSTILNALDISYLPKSTLALPQEPRHNWILEWSLWRNIWVTFIFEVSPLFQTTSCPVLIDYVMPDHLRSNPYSATSHNTIPGVQGFNKRHIGRETWRHSRQSLRLSVASR